MTKREQIEQYLDIGLTVIPLIGKVANYHWKEYLYNPRDFSKPGVNVGLRTGILPDKNWFYVIDIDTKEGLGEMLPQLPQAVPIVSTNRGFHLYLQWKEMVVTRHFPNLDIICGGYVVSPPSIGKTGKPYRFITPLKEYIPAFNPLSLDIANNSPLSFVHPHENYAHGPLNWEDIYSGVSVGSRHSTLVSYLGHLLRWNTDIEDIISTVARWNNLCRPPMDEQEVLQAVRTCFKAWGPRR